MHFLLVVLKGIGMILAILLLVVLLLLFAVLFSPIRYQIEGENEEQVSVSFQGNFLLFVLRFAGAYQKKQVTFQVKVFGYPVFRYPKPEVTQKRKKRSKKKKTCATDDSSQKAVVIIIQSLKLFISLHFTAIFIHFSIASARLRFLSYA